MARGGEGLEVLLWGGDGVEVGKARVDLLVGGVLCLGAELEIMERIALVLPIAVFALDILNHFDEQVDVFGVNVTVEGGTAILFEREAREEGGVTFFLDRVEENAKSVFGDLLHGLSGVDLDEDVKMLIKETNVGHGGFIEHILSFDDRGFVVVSAMHELSTAVIADIFLCGWFKGAVEIVIARVAVQTTAKAFDDGFAGDVEEDGEEGLDLFLGECFQNEVTALFIFWIPVEDQTVLIHWRGEFVGEIVEGDVGRNDLTLLHKVIELLTDFSALVDFFAE